MRGFRVTLGFVLIIWATGIMIATAGENVTMYDAAHRVLTPGQVDRADMTATCGDCHDVTQKTGSVHFNRSTSSDDSEPTDCLACHLREGNNAFGADGTITKLVPRPSDAACASCHDDVAAQCPKRNTNAHSRSSCIDCHASAGHRPVPSPSCIGCHDGKSKAPNPSHTGFTAIHFEKLACETCHSAAAATAQDTQQGSYAVHKGRTFPTGPDGSLIHHGILRASHALGAGGCTDCHSTRPNSLFRAIAALGGTQGAPKLTRLGMELGAAREGVVKPCTPWIIALIVALSIIHYTVFGPRRVKAVRGERTVERYSVFERLIHGLATLSFTFLAVTGVLFLMRMDSPSGPWRGIHGHVGTVFAGSLVGVVVIWCKDARFCSADRHWLRYFGGYLWASGICPAGKFNAGQKLFFWFVALTGALISVTGFLMAAGGQQAASWVYTLHDFAALLMILAVLGHVYLGVFANSGSLMGIVRGRVAESWARHHHPDWIVKRRSDV